ncbi:hypothetical protein ACVNIS_24760 (plasmid) [Sphaerotilaceae bacterium SBD11-9]
MANPQGPKAQAECVEDIDKLFRDLRHGRRFPRCEMGSAPEGTMASNNNAEAVQRYTWHDACPDGLTSLAAGERGVLGSTVAANYGYPPPTEIATGIGEGSGEVSGEYGTTVSRKACVGNKIGETFDVDTYGFPTGTIVNVYDRMVLLDPLASPNVIDVNINGQLYRRVRW